MGADVGLATTGVIGPEAQEGQPVGSVRIGVSLGEGPASAHRVDIDGDPDRVRARALRHAIDVVTEQLS